MNKVVDWTVTIMPHQSVDWTITVMSYRRIYTHLWDGVRWIYLGGYWE